MISSEEFSALPGKISMLYKKKIYATSLLLWCLNEYFEAYKDLPVPVVQYCETL